MFNPLKRIKMARKKNTDKKTETAEVKTPVVDEKPVVETETETAPKVETPVEETPAVEAPEEKKTEEEALAPKIEDTKEEEAAPTDDDGIVPELILSSVSDDEILIRSNTDKVRNTETNEIQPCFVVERKMVKFYEAVK